MPIKNQKTKVARKPLPKNNYRKKRAANLKAYRRKKMRFQAMRRPFVEIKKRSHLDLWETFGGSTTFPTVDTITNPMALQNMTNSDTDKTPKRSHIFPIWSYMNPVQGITEKDMLGTTLTAKYLTAKVNFQFPSDLQTNNPKYYMVHGWVKVPTNLTIYTTPSRTDFTRTQLLQHLTNHISRDFDQNKKEEFLYFKEAERKDIQILSYRRVKPDQNSLQVPIDTDFTTSSQVQVIGKLPQVNMTFKWPCANRKIKYEKGTDSTMTGSAPFYYDNKGWLPFLLYYCPSAGMGIGPGNGEAKSPSIAYNDQFWFSDS